MGMSPALSLYLTKFISGADPNKFTAGWKEVLGEPPTKSARRLEADGLIERAGTFDTLNILLTLNDLKKLLTERGQKQTGTKAVLVSRLIECDFNKATALTKGSTVYICTARGNEIAQQIKEQLTKEKDEAERKVLEFLYQGNFIEASRTVSRYEANQVFQRGIGIDWNSSNHHKEAKQLEIIFRQTPQLLASVKNDIYPARVIAGMLYLWGKSDYTPPDSVLKDISINFHLGIKVIARMLVFYAQNLRSIEEYKESGVVKKIKILSANDQRTCDSCKKINGGVYSLNNALELPHKDCSCLDGCRCTYLPII